MRLTKHLSLLSKAAFRIGFGVLQTLIETARAYFESMMLSCYIFLAHVIKGNVKCSDLRFQVGLVRFKAGLELVLFEIVETSACFGLLAFLVTENPSSWSLP